MVVSMAMEPQSRIDRLVSDGVAVIIPLSIWFLVVLSSKFESGWVSFSCSGLVGFFMWLTALAYGERRFAHMTAIGVLLSAILSFLSGMYAIFS